MLTKCFSIVKTALWTLGFLLCLAIAMLIPSTDVWGQSSPDNLVIEQPVLLVTGTDIVTDVITAFFESEEPIANTDSPYKHISYGGAPYNIDAITSATLTVEGPGVYNCVPISLRELEGSANGNIYRGAYSDTRGSGNVNFSYEGVKLLPILDGLINSQVERLDDNVVVVFKNRWRQEIGRAAYIEIKNAATPIILAYGTASPDETTIPPVPFVFNLAAGTVPGLGNDDGPLKLVYDQSEFSGLASASPKFTSVAYLYLEEGTPPPGFKHITASDPAYSNKVNTEYLVTLTGSALGREINFTVEELEKMVEYENDAPQAGGLGHRDEYSLSNTTYWYVNEYEGIKVWDLLNRLGLNAQEYQDDDETLVSFSAWDNYQITAQFSMKQLAHPDLFYFYEKSPLDIGANRPTKAQLATPEFQPDNQIGVWLTDTNSYPVKKGYPVMLAYGVNGYPYVRDSNLPGYKSGLGNHGGPLRVIYGKTDGLNRDNPDALENYAYFFNNGSQQLQRVQEVYVGEPLRYSTHLQNPATAYQEMKDRQALTVEIVSGGSTQTHVFTLAELENILYGLSVGKRERDSENRQEKGYYITRVAGTNPIQELYEGVNLEYLLTEHVGLPGALGTVEIYSGSGTVPDGVYNLADISEKGYNSAKGTAGLGMMVAFAKNAFPLVDGPNNATDNTNPGYVHNDPLDNSKGIRNGLGPLHFIRAQTAAERAAGTVNSLVGEAKTLVENLSKIVVKLDPDIFAHIGTEYGAYANQNILFKGAIAQLEGKNITVGNLETKQKYIITDSYTIDGLSYIYRGLDLAALLNDKDIGASVLMEEITVKNSLGEQTTLTLADLTTKKAILAYGIAKTDDPADGKPLVPTSASSGYAAAYLNSGGPLRLIFAGGTEAQCISNVSEIEIKASTLNAWKHTSGNFLQYATFELAISGQNLAHNMIFSVAELEAMDNIIVSDAYQMGGSTWIQGIDLYKLLQNIGFAGDLDSSAFTANSVDNYPISFNASDLKNGVNGKPILIAFGQGTNSSNGLPLVPEISSPGYDPNVGNAYGPLRLVVHDNTGWCVKYLNSIVVGAAGGTEELDNSFTLYSGGENGMPQASIRAITIDQSGGIWAGSNGAGMAYISPGGIITDYSTTSLPALKTDYVTGLAIAPDNSLWLCQGGSVGSQTAPPSAHYGFARYKNGVFTFYDRNSAKSTLTSDCIYGIDADKDGNVWLASQHTLLEGGMEGSLTKFNPSSNTWQTWKMTDGLPTVSAWAVKSDNQGGAWVTTYRTSNPPFDAYTWPDKSYAHVGADNFMTSYTIPAGNDYTWSRSIAIDSEGGAYITRMSGAHDPANDGGWLDYLAPDGKTQSYKGNDLITAIKNTKQPGFSPEIRTVFVDNGGDIWLSTNGLGVYRCSVSGNTITVLDHFSSAQGSWPAGPFDDVWSIHVSPSGKAVFGSNGGVAWTDVLLKPGITVLEPPFTIKQGSKPDVSWVVGGSGNSIKNLVSGQGGKVEASYRNDGQECLVRGAYLSDILAASSVSGNNILVNITTTSGFSFGDIIFADISAKKYFLAYDVYNTSTAAWDKIEDVDANKVQASLRIYRNFDSGAVGQKNNEIKNISGLTISIINDPTTTNPSGEQSVGDATPSTAQLTISGAVELPGYFTISGLKTWPGLTQRTKTYSTLNNAGNKGSRTMSGVYLEDLLNNVLRLKSTAKSITVTASDGYYFEFNLDAKISEMDAYTSYAGNFKARVPGVYATDMNGNKLMLAWEDNGSSLSSLRLVVGQIDPNHINNPMWVNNIKSITVNNRLVGSGSPLPPVPAEEDTATISLELKATVTVIDGIASATNTLEEVQKALKALGENANGQSKLLLIDATTDEQTNKTTYTLPCEALDLLTEDAQTSMELATSQGSIHFSAKLLKHLGEHGEESLITEIGTEITTETENLATVEISIQRGDTLINSFNNILLKANIPLSPTTSMQTEGLVIYHILDNGEKTLVKLSSYDTANSIMRLGVKHLSTYAIGYNPITFPDIQGHLGQSCIEFLASRNIVNGRTNDTFDPEGKVSRAEFLKMLAETVDELDIMGAAQAGFSDVADSAWFINYVNWAAGLGIAQGNTDGTFRPHGLITREQMAALTERFIKALKFDIKITQTVQEFGDQEQISSYASGAIRSMQQYGIINGNPDGNFNPQGTATRAEAAKVIKTFIEAVLE
ncbi:MAG: S-layer homology domain-containing protein [Clostridiales bacterium]|nr:S-layer homology domain-containing protein [Clostridiales bacterium]